MKSTMICGLIALQLAAGATAQAQNYFFKIEGDVATRVADHASWQQGPAIGDETLEAYNLDLPDGGKAIGTIRFHAPSAYMSYATHYRLTGKAAQIVARRIVIPSNGDIGFFVIAEKVKSGVAQSAVVLYYDRSNGKLIKTWELSTLPTGFRFLQVHDVILTENATNEMRILCTVTQAERQGILELLLNTSNSQYKVKEYKPAHLALDKYNSVYYIRRYYYNQLGMSPASSFYGMGISNGKSVAYCYSSDQFEKYNLIDEQGADEVTGVQMNGMYTSNNDPRINMAFTDKHGDVCIQQKDNMTTLNWRQFYHLPGKKLRMSMGRDGHGTKGEDGMHYFIAAAQNQEIVGDNGYITTLHFNALNGSMNKPNIYNLSGIGVNGNGGFPNTTPNASADYIFIADRFNQKNGFKLGTGNSAATGAMPCTELHELKEANNLLVETVDRMNITTFDAYNALPITLVKAENISVAVYNECEVQQRPGIQENAKALQQGSLNLMMNTTSLRMEAAGKLIASMRLLSIDGRLVSTAAGINSGSYQQQFNNSLTPGIYLVQIRYTDNSTEVRKVSVQ